MTDYTKLSNEEKEALVQKAMQVGYDTEMNYGNCIQSTLNGIYQAFPDYGVTPELIKACFGVAGGCGCSLLGTCGALNGAAVAISVSHGRPLDDFGGQYDSVHAEVREVVDKFNKEFDGTLCTDVMKKLMGGVYDWKTPQGLEDYLAHNGSHCCATAVKFCTEIVARKIVNGEL